MDSRLKKLLQNFNLASEVDDHAKIREAIERDVIFKGTNLWILNFAIIVASVGLNMNSPAVVIGAMLISPLMGPINGMGYSIATYNFQLFSKAVKNFTFAVLAGLVASTLYFAISPIRIAHSELLSRTSPTIYDVMIALFGGLAGIVAICSKQKGNVIPGVAIATALMPPLCTAGYGLATAQFNYFFGALYLFTINTVFIAISAMVVSQILKFPHHVRVGAEKISRVNRWTTAVIIVTIVPSIYFGYLLVQKEHFAEYAARFVNNVSVYGGNYLLGHEIDPKTKTITLIYGGTSFTEAQKKHIKEKSDDFDLPGANVLIQQGLSFDSLRHQLSETQSLTAEIELLSSQLLQQEQQQDSIVKRVTLGKQLLNEIQPLYPAIGVCSYSETLVYQDTVAEGTETAIIVFGVSGGTLESVEKIEIRRWLEARLQTSKIRVYFDELQAEQ